MNSPDITIGEGNLAGKGVYAARDFKKDETITINDKARWRIVHEHLSGEG